jgi:hypothetical protein
LRDLCELEHERHDLLDGYAFLEIADGVKRGPELPRVPVDLRGRVRLRVGNARGEAVDGAGGAS